MGTSTSSSGGKAGSPFDPEWLAPESPLGGADSDSSDASEGESGDDGENDSENGDDGAGAPSAEDAAYAPSRRFADARMKMGAYMAGGGRESLRAATKSMVSKGMGGSQKAASTMRGTAHAAGALGQFLASARDRSDPQVVDWVDRVRQANLSAEDLILELVKEVLPDTGSVDDESTRNAGAEALGQVTASTVVSRALQSTNLGPPNSSFAMPLQAKPHRVRPQEAQVYTRERRGRH